MGPGERQFDDDAPTQVDGAVSAPPPAPSRPVSAPSTPPTGPSGHGEESRGGHSASRSLVTARETLILEEIHRTRSFLRMSVVLAICQVPPLFFIGGDPLAKKLLITMAAIVCVTCGVVLALMREDEGYTVSRANVAAFSTIFAVFAAVFFYGVFSPAVVIIPLGVQFYCAGHSTRATLSVVVACGLGYAAMVFASVSGLIPDSGLVKAADIPRIDRLVMLVVIELIFVAVYFIARSVRAATLHAIERHDVVIRSLAQRDALLREARADLAQAMRIGGVGRFSGEVLGRFRLGGVIGRGAMGEVYEGVEIATNQEVAVKLVHPQLLAERDVVERFLREAKVTSTLDAANVVRVVEASPPDAPIPYLAMERLKGEDLATWLRDNKRMGMKKFVNLVRQVSNGLDAAHKAGIVHRDLKPRNLFCARSGNSEVWKILDFGVSKLDSSEGTLTRGQIVGTPAYMAPEQARALPVGPAADIFALGVIAYRTLTGSPPFTGETSVEILFRVSNAMPVRPSDLVKLPPQVDSVLAIALAKEPAERFQTASAFADALDAASRNRLSANLSNQALRLLEESPWDAGIAGIR